MLIPDTDFYPSRIPISDSGSNKQHKRGRGKKFVLPFFEAARIKNFKIILFLNW
jgi:hypothetical protein